MLHSFVRRLGVTALGSAVLTVVAPALAGGWSDYVDPDVAEVVGLPPTDLDPNTRVWRPRWRCTFGAGPAELLALSLRRDVFEALVAGLGPPQGAWTMPYPSRAQAEALLRTGVRVPFDALGQGQVRGRDLTLGPDVRDGLEYALIVPREVTVAFAGDTLVVGRDAPARVDGDTSIVLVDTARGGAFAVYGPFR